MIKLANPQLRFNFRENWTQNSLKNLSNLITKQTGFDYSKTIKPSLERLKTTENIPFIQNKDFNPSSLNMDTDYFIPRKIQRLFPKISLQEKCILISISGKVGNIGIFDEEDIAFIGGAVCVIKFPSNNKDKIDFIKHFFTSSIGQKKLLREVIASSHKNITIEQIRKITFFLPANGDELRSISSFLSLVDKKIELLTKKHEQLEKYKKGLMQKIFSQEIRFKQDDGKDFPDWEIDSLGNIGKATMCKRIFANETTTKGDIPFYKIGTFGKKPDAFISKDKYLEYKEKFNYPRKGEILISASGTIGKTVIFNGEPSYFQDSNIVWLANSEKKVKNIFLEILYKNIDWKPEGSILARLYNSNLEGLKVTFPIIDEQQKIATFLSAVNKKIDLIKQQIEKTQTFKKGLLQQMFV